MALRLHNTLTKKTEEFTPITDRKVTLYTCGPTVYNFLHVGNWAAYIYWDTLVRTLIADGYAVERVMNITDVGHLTGENDGDADNGEDKLQKGARREGKTAWEVAEFYAEDFMNGMEKLGMITPEHVVKATDFIPQQLDLARILKEKGYTYQITDGIYFDTSKFPTYADFAGLDLAAQKAGARIEFNPEKRNASDFALWKFTAPDEKRDMEWDTPADLLDNGESKKGFPGWHLECSAMAMSILGPTIDIHTGGIDHIPVHHTNEIAQSESASGQKFANFWLHNNHLKVNGTKISKSLGNGYTLQDLEERGFSPIDYRMFILQGQYSNEGNFTFENLQAAKNRLIHWRNIAALRHQTHDTLSDDSEKSTDDKSISLLAASGAIHEAMNNDLNTPEAMRIIDEAFSKLDGKSLDDIHQHGLDELIHTVDDLLGLQLETTTPDINDEMKQLIIERERARDNKDWAESDRLRDKLSENNIVVRDTKHGSIWEYKN
ncbi:MAG TPA: cysteine--tRNA ligase [Candidatus Saccharimonadales bacterium]|nr:cysteine--tRNA ligase [Candidatus Saccharimonadales bacterium]